MANNHSPTHIPAAESAYTIMVSLGCRLSPAESDNLYLALREAQFDTLSGGFLISEVRAETCVTFFREAETDGDSIRRNHPDLIKTNVVAAAMKQVAGEIMDASPTNQHLLLICEALSGRLSATGAVKNCSGLESHVLHAIPPQVAPHAA